MSGASRVTGGQGGNRTPGGNGNSKRGAGRGAGETKPGDNATSCGERPRSRGAFGRQPVSDPARTGAGNDKGAALPDEGRKAARGEKPLNE
jgi:hypothetical protein